MNRLKLNMRVGMKVSRRGAAEAIMAIRQGVGERSKHQSRPQTVLHTQPHRSLTAAAPSTYEYMEGVLRVGKGGYGIFTLSKV